MPVVGAYPHPDSQVMDLLTDNFSPEPLLKKEHYIKVQTQELVMRYHMFFKHLFDTVREKLGSLETNDPAKWQTYLSDNAIDQTLSNRQVLYQDIVNRVKADDILKKAREVRPCPFWE